MIIASGKKNTLSRINLMKDVQALHTENYKIIETLKKTFINKGYPILIFRLED